MGAFVVLSSISSCTILDFLRVDNKINRTSMNMLPACPEANPRVIPKWFQNLE